MRPQRSRAFGPEQLPVRITPFSIVMILSDRFHKNADYIGVTNECKCLRPVWMGLSLGPSAQPRYGYFGNAPRVFFLTNFPHLNYGGHNGLRWCSRLELGGSSTTSVDQILLSPPGNLRMSLQETSQNLSTPPSPEHSAHKRPVSERRIHANRRNALRSTGPKTARGKRTVARNAIKHGLLAREVVIAAGDGEENLEEFHFLVDRLWESYEPVGIVEESLMQTIASCWWRKARVLRAENGEIRKRLDTIAVDRAMRNSDNTNLVLAVSHLELGFFRRDEIPLMEQWAGMQHAQTTLRTHHPGLAFLRALLEEAKSGIASEGYMSETIRKELFLAFCFWDYSFAIQCRYSGPPETKADGTLWSRR